MYSPDKAPNSERPDPVAAGKNNNKCFWQIMTIGTKY